MEKIEELLFNDTIGKVVAFILGAIIIWSIGRLIQSKLFSKIKDTDSRYKAKKFGSFLAWVAIIVYFSIVYSSKLGGLTVALGVAGAGIAFALQEVIASVAGWLAILFGGFYKTGDRVQLGGIKGDIIDIGVLRTTLMELGQWVDGDLYNGRIVRIANSFVFKEPVFNYSADFPFLWDEVKIPVKFGSDYQLAEELIQKAGDKITGAYAEEAKGKWKEMTEKYLIESANINPMVSLVANDNWVEFTLRYIVDFKKRRITKNDVFKEILSSVDKSQGKIILASATFELVGMPDITLKK
ncbi:Small-conductance mechanosensitive channel [Ekhidna lutea]|uniref:Small-conductance mechanosensitive channel n=1 Tax=Ekhidna lutea TaxID=447679 RepID=A0A239K003_EKHLU|nr:mechanosensitive ion channel domain-containing protein [Ekhidna lutea]SNT10364.1 Small-conductance mechanosensitive channel [Ekhidna lutea]